MLTLLDIFALNSELILLQKASLAGVGSHISLENGKFEFLEFILSLKTVINRTLFF